MKHYLSIVFLFLLLFVACDPAAELGTPFHKGQEVVLTAAIGEQRPQMMPSMQRISGKDAPETIDLLWDEGDEIRVHVGEASSVFRFVAGAGTANASFIGTMPASGSSYEVTYPKENNDDLLLQQTYVPDGIAKGLMKMSTTSPGTIDKGFTLSAEHAVLGLQLTGNREIGKIVLTKNDADGKAAKPSYTLLCPKVTLTETATLFYIVLPVGIWEKGFTVDVYAADNTTIIDTFVTNKRFEFIAANATTMAEKDVQDPPKRIGVFSVGAGKKVSFSQGNLQYTQSTDTWQFAEHQYDCIGKGNITNGQLGQIIDMFGWSADADPANKWGVTIAEEGFDGDFVDWGLNYIHGEAPGSWRTLSQDEWSYLLSCRQHATELWGVAQVAGVNGVIILPDRWIPTDDLPFVAGINENGYAAQQTLSVEQWQLMEELGAVFLPAAGGRNGASLAFSHIDSVGWYWLSTPTDPGKASCVRFECNLMVQRNGWRQAGLSVRLVHDTIVPMPEPEYVDLGLSVKWATFNVGASKPEGYGDYFAWGETEPKTNYDWSTYKWCDGTENNMTKYNATDGLKTLLPEDDAAHVNWGGEWRMPSDAELTELREYCTWQWTTQNGTAGYIVTGPNGNSIFLPDAGYRITTTHTIGNAYYWTRDLNTTVIQNANGIYFNQDRTGKDKYRRRCGFSVRPVLPADREILTPATPGKHIGVFSVAAGKKVSFSQGNLQYTQSTDTWQFAEHQYDFIGEDNIQNGQLANRIDLFGWSGKDSQVPYGISTSTNAADYAGDFVDWGENTISGDAPGTWRTLSREEFDYLMNKRLNAASRLAIAQVNGVNGLILLPDIWQITDEVELKTGLYSTCVADYSVHQSVSEAEWKILENAGAVFLPASGRRSGSKIIDLYQGIYWTSTIKNNSPYNIHFQTDKIRIHWEEDTEFYARSVRLVHDTIVPKVEPEYVDLGLSVKWATFNVGASKPEDYGDYFAWGETETKETYSWATYKWGASSNLTKYNTMDGKTTLDPEDDAAKVLWGGKWRMPSDEEYQELIDKCNWEWTTSNSINGYRVKGPNGNSIFLPAGGVRIGNASYAIGEFGYYWSSLLLIDDKSEAHSAVFTQSFTRCDSDNRYRGRKIRPVYDDNSEQ